MPNPETFNPNIAHISAGPDGPVFQVLNETGDDWDEPATRAAYDAYLAEQSAP